MSVQPESMRGRPAVAVVTVTYNRYEPLLILFDQLQKLDYDPACLEIFLVDNASTDDTVAQVREHFPKVHIVENAENTGVSAGFNRSIQEAFHAARDYQYLWLLDSDAEVEPATLKVMVDAMEADETIGVAGSSVYDPQERDRLVTAGLRVDWKRGDIPLFVPSKDEQAPLLDVDLIPACSMLTRASIYPDVGLWDDRFPLYWGDTDWCARVQREGYRVCCTPESRAWHRDWSNVVRGFGADSFIRDHLRGALLFFLRHDPDGTAQGARRLLLKISFKAGLERLTMRSGYADAYQNAARDLLAGRFDRNFNAPSAQPARCDLDQIGAELARLVSPRPTIVLNQIVSPERCHVIKEVLEQYFDGINWMEIAPEQPAGAEWSEYRAFKPRQLLSHAGRILRGFGRPDINICDISTPLLYNFVAGRYTVLLDEGGHGLVERASVVGCIGRALSAIIGGIKTVYLDLPRELKNGIELRAAIADDLAKTCSISMCND